MRKIRTGLIAFPLISMMLLAAILYIVQAYLPQSLIRWEAKSSLDAMHKVIDYVLPDRDFVMPDKEYQTFKDGNNIFYLGSPDYMGPGSYPRSCAFDYSIPGIDWKGVFESYQRRVRIGYPLTDMYSEKDDENIALEQMQNNIMKHAEEYSLNEICTFDMDGDTVYMEVVEVKGDNHPSYRVLMYVYERDLRNAIAFIKYLRKAMWICFFLAAVVTLTVALWIVFGIRRDFSQLRIRTNALARRKNYGRKASFENAELQQIYSSVYALAKVRRRSEQSQRLFFQNASEQLRKPLLSIKEQAQCIAARQDGPDTYFQLEKSGVEMTGLVEELLLSSKIDSDAFHGEFQEAYLAELADSVIGQMRKKARKNKIKVEIDFQEGLPAIWTEEDLLKKAFQILMSYILDNTEASARIWLREKENQQICRMEAYGVKPEPKLLVYLYMHFPQEKRGKYDSCLPLAKQIIDYVGGQVEALYRKNGFCIQITFSEEIKRPKYAVLRSLSSTGCSQ